jgi:hypothetical protein
MSEYTTAVTGILTSIVRTLVPYLVGLIVSVALELGVDLSQDPATIGAITSGITLLVGTVYYAIVRELETRVSPAWGWLLGRAKAPDYTAASGELG